MVIRPFLPSDEDSLIELWRACDLVRPWNDPSKDIQRKLQFRPEWLLVATAEAGRVVGSIMIGYDGHRGWVNYLAVAPAYRRLGYARRLLKEAEQILKTEGCPKINLQIRVENAEAIRFYQRLGYSTDACVSLGRRLISDG